MRYFKTGKGQYGEGDVFLGLTVPEVRQVAKKYSHLPLEDVLELLSSKYHEERQCALFIMVNLFEIGDSAARRLVYESYLSNTKFVNNWDLVDGSAPYISGVYLADNKKDVLLRLAKSSNIWERRIAILSTLAFIKNGETAWTYRLAKMLLDDNEDLIHKAVGWMLREAGKVNKPELVDFLNAYKKRMPRTMLRYSIEKFNDKERKEFLS